MKNISELIASTTELETPPAQLVKARFEDEQPSGGVQSVGGGADAGERAAGGAAGARERPADAGSQHAERRSCVADAGARDAQETGAGAAAAVRQGRGGDRCGEGPV